MAGPTSEFQTPLDIMNRACDHLGVPHIASLSPLDDSKPAVVLSSIYDKVRRAELQRNLWRFAIRSAPIRAINNLAGALFSSAPTPTGAPTMLLVPGAWSISQTYLTGSIVSYDGQLWSAMQNTLGVEPDVAAPQWDIYFGSMIATPYDTTGGENGTTTYFSGDIVFTLSGTTPTIFLAVVTGNEQLAGSSPPSTPEVPGTVDAWNSGQFYMKYDTVTGSDANVYQSNLDLNVDINPVGDAGVHWSLLSGVANQATAMSGQTWLQLSNCTLTQIRIVYPVGTGPFTQSTTKNIYQLPNGYLKEAPQDPRAGAISFLGAPGGYPQDDWVFQGNYLVSKDEAVIVLRFGADVTYVPSMTAMFCEGLAARLAIEGCEAITQSTEKMQAIGSAYKGFMGEARMANGIETGYVDPPIDDYLAARM
jgi:hypothetical protein